MLLKNTRAVDIALFGRMFASRTELQMAAAAQVAHAFTVSQALVEADLFVAVDDRKDADFSGAAFLGELDVVRVFPTRVGMTRWRVGQTPAALPSPDQVITKVGKIGRSFFGY
jgi:hypothetical protein